MLAKHLMKTNIKDAKLIYQGKGSRRTISLHNKE